MIRLATDILVARAGGLRLPDFLCIGAQKSGTSWLYEQLRRSPGVWMPDEKELHYFDRTESLRRGIRWYASHFTPAGDLLTGDITPAYATLRGLRLQRVFRCLPNIRVVFIARHPVDRVWSALRMYASEQHQTVPLALGEKWIRQQAASEPVLLRTAYRETVELWERRYGTTGVRCEPYDAITQDPHALLSRICEFLGVDPPTESGSDVGEIVFAGQQSRAPDWLEELLFELYADSVEWGMERFGDHVSDWRGRGRITG